MSVGCTAVYDYTLRSLKNKELPIIIGGDHTISSGSVAASCDHYNEKLHTLWIDAHADIHTFKTSDSQNKHGMPVASLIGLMKPFVNSTQSLKLSQLTYMGLRDVDTAEKEVLDQLSLTRYDIDAIKAIGLNNIIKKIKKDNKDKKFHISLDIDALDPQFAPSTGTPSKNGLTMNHIKYIISQLSSQIIAFDLVEVNPCIGTLSQINTTLNNSAKILNSLSNCLKKNEN